MVLEDRKMPIHYARLGLNIRTARESKGLSQKQLAEELQITNEHLSHLERGRRRVQLDTLNRICELLDVPYEQLLEGAVDISIHADNTPSANARKTAAELFSDITSTCSEEKIAKLLNICRNILELPR